MLQHSRHTNRHECSPAAAGGDDAAAGVAPTMPTAAGAGGAAVAAGRSSAPVNDEQVKAVVPEQGDMTVQTHVNIATITTVHSR